MKGIIVIVVVALVAAAAGCGGKPEAREPKGEEVDPDEAEREARSVIEEAYGSMRRGNAEGLLPLLAEDLFVAGPRSADVGLARSDAVVALTAALDAARKPKHKVKSRDLSVVATAGGRSAWATDQVEIDGVPYALTALVAQIDDLWVITAIHVARTVPDKQLKKRVKDGALVRPAPIAAATPPDPKARELIALVTEAANDPAELLDQIGGGGDVIAIGTAPQAVTRGKKKIRKAWKKRDKKKATFTTLQGEPMVRLGADGAHAWVLANVDVSRDGDEDVVAPHRAFYVYARGDDGWELVVFHDAVVH